jgi:minor extracellular protease Epr
VARRDTSYGCIRPGSVAILATVALSCAAPPASAQLLPGGILDRPVPGAPPVGDIVNRGLSDLRDTVDGVRKSLREAVPRTLSALGGRRERIVEDGWLAVDREWVALISPEQLPVLEAARLNIVDRTQLPSSNMVMVRVVVSPQDDNAGRAQQILRGFGATSVDRNHIYNEQRGPDAAAPDIEPAPQPAAAGRRPRIGLLDTALNRNHPALKKADIVEKDFVQGSSRRPTAHGTAIASLLVGKEKDHPGLLQSGLLVSASVFYRANDDVTGATTASLAAALDWMAGQDVGVVNMSLAGPPNAVLAQMIDHLAERGVLVVAAVGNDGPAARPLYPAAYAPVVAVTAVDRKSQVYRWANQGPQVDLAAWGVRSVVARDRGGYVEETGTSFAAPVVAAAIARLIAEGHATSSSALKRLIEAAEDLGPSGRDNVFGHGLVR